VSRVLTENSPGTDHPAETAFVPLVPRNGFEEWDITPQGADLVSTAVVQPEQSNPWLTAEDCS